MHMDVSLLRRILQLLDETGEPVYAEVLTNSHVSQEVAAYHIYLLIDGGFVDGHTTKADGGRIVFASAVRMTWAGQQFYANIRSNKIWDQVKNALATIGGSASVQVLSSLAVQAVQQTIHI